LKCNAEVWNRGVQELRIRTRGSTRESGAFLLGSDEGGFKRISEFVFYDDIDPHALDTGVVHFDGTKFSQLWSHCRLRGCGVVADVHVHPGGYRQSRSDRANPVMPRSGHYAIILPDFAALLTQPGGIGMYEYRGDGRWITRTNEGSEFFELD
jgi:hypothetical protein